MEQKTDQETVPYSDEKRGQAWKYFATVSICLSICLVALFHKTAWSMVSIWWRSDTFAHCFLILPIVIWLIWDRRGYLRRFNPESEYWVLILLFGAGSLWLIAYLVGALVIQQLALVSLIVFGIWTILGTRVTWAMVFPLLFLFFSVPMGEDLVPGLMEFTATFTVWLLKLTGVPVYREGLFFSLPSGDWSVVEACSGVRYLIASIVLGSLFAYLTYKKIFKRLIFIIASILVPIFANSVRAYIIVMIGHLSDMKLATGIDHLIYGWLFFGLVILILFSIGSIWRDTTTNEDQKKDLTETYGALQQVPDFQKVLKAGGIIILVAGIWPLLAYAIDHQQPVVPVMALQAPESSGGWNVSKDDTWLWRPVIHGADEEIFQFYKNKEISVSLYVGQYLSQKQGAELVGSQNILVKKKDEKWRIISNGKNGIRLNGERVEVDQAMIRGDYKELLVWHWYRVGEMYTSNPYIAKFHEAMARLTFSRQAGVKLVVATQINESKDVASNSLQQFLNEMLPEMEYAIDLVVNEVR